jgi:hypothetical protein
MVGVAFFRADTGTEGWTGMKALVAAIRFTQASEILYVTEFRSSCFS